MENEAEINRLRHAKSVWRGIALGLGATLILLLVVAVVGGVFLAKGSRAMRAEEAARRERDAALHAEEVKRAAEKQKAKP